MFDRLRKLFTRSYDGAAQGGRRWRGQPEMPETLSAMHAARGPLARRARYLASNNALAASGVEAWVSALTGSWRRRIEALQHGVVAFQALRPIWKRWATT